LGGAVAQLSETIAALGQGDRAIGVAPISDPRAREILGELVRLFRGMEGEMAQMLEGSPELFRVRDAADSIFINSDLVLATSDYLITQYEAMADQRPVKPWFGFAFGGLALVLLF